MNHTFKTALLVSLLIMSGCQSISKEDYDKARTEAAMASQKAADLSKENAMLKEQQLTYEILTTSLKSEIDDQQVLIEKLENKTVKITLQNAVLFSSGQFELNKNGKQVLKKLLPTLQEQPDGHIVRVIGHTDALPVHAPRQEYVDNWDLSARRAANVVRYFVWALQLPANIFRVEGHAFVEPVDTNETPEGRLKNRRIEIVIEQ